jgi:hypothetical protein
VRTQSCTTRPQIRVATVTWRALLLAFTLSKAAERINLTLEKRNLESSVMSEFQIKTLSEFIAEYKPRDPRASRTPYGKWTCESGRQVLFDRGYRPIYQRSPDGSVSEADLCEWVESIVDSVFFWHAGTRKTAKARAVRQALNEWGLV